MFWNDSCDFDPKSALLAVRIVALARDIATHSVSQVLFDAGEPRPAAQQTTTFMLITGTSTRVPTAIDFVGVPVMVQANGRQRTAAGAAAVSYTHLRAHETVLDL